MKKTTSNAPTASGERSSTSSSRSSTFEFNARRASSNPAFFPQPSPVQQNESTATTRDAPRRSASNEKKPSQAPISSTVLPANDAGNFMRSSLAAVSSSPGVTTPSPNGI